MRSHHGQRRKLPPPISQRTSAGRGLCGDLWGANVGGLYNYLVEVMRDIKFAIGTRVEKFTGDYTGPGVVRGITILEGGKVLYLVGHRIEGGKGEFVHVYSAANLRVRP